MGTTLEPTDLPVLNAAVDLFEEEGRGPRASVIEAQAGFDDETVQRALWALHRETYFDRGLEGDDQIVVVGKPTGSALRVAGTWLAPEVQLNRLIVMFTAAAEDKSRAEEDRNRFKQAGLWLTGALSQVAIGALGGVGGNLMSSN
jgi:hypothetical protein